jgi:S-DNA-T family DNA segregation ATPase FtsK/SpoIIIE
MARKKSSKIRKKTAGRQSRVGLRLDLPEETKRWIFGVIMFFAAAIIILAFFDLAGVAGKMFMKVFTLLIGKTTFALPLFLFLGGLAFFVLRDKNKWQILLAILILLSSASGILATIDFEQRHGGWIGELIAWPVFKAFGFWASQIIFFGLAVIGGVIFWQILYRPIKKEKQKEVSLKVPAVSSPSLIRKIFRPKFKIKEVPSSFSESSQSAQDSLEKGKTSLLPEEKELSPMPQLKVKPVNFRNQGIWKNYKLLPLSLLEEDRGAPAAGDIRINSAIIKRTLQNFDIPVEMSEINIGPTVTQYTLKPAEGVKLSKITALASDLALALAAHPIRIEAPIPGRPLVGVEVPNKARAMVRLKNLLESAEFQNSDFRLNFALGRDVSTRPFFASLEKMPHLLVAGSTGTGKTICLNSLILSLLYRNSPEILKLILIDPKRVEFPVYNELPHLLTPVIFDAQKAVLSLKWLIGEMERRFGVLSEARSRDIAGYNNIQLGQGQSPMPYIVLIVDELADLMAARGREMEAGIVRLAQMARAVGIHLVLATQRPSVEVITGLIKANITSRIAFQVASQVDSRTILDRSGAEKLLGLGDMLFVSAETIKPKRIQGAYTSEKEVKRVINYIKSNFKKEKETEELKEEGSSLAASLSDSLEKTLKEQGVDFSAEEGEDPMYEEARRVVIEAKKASASLLQRRLRVGYARAARLIDMLEERGVVGPGEGAKPREILVLSEDEENWKKV